MIHPDITIIIPNYNGVDLLKRNLPSVIEASDRYPGKVSIIVVDDGSKDNSTEMLRKQFSQVETIIHDYNRGFAEAIMSGVAAAQTELLFLLNSDVTVSPDCLVRLVPYFDDAETFSVCPLIYEEDGTINRHSWNLRDVVMGRLQSIPWKLEEAVAIRSHHKLRTLYSSGGSVMLRRSMFLQLQGFCPLFKPFYGEDYDLGVRAWRHGWSNYFEPSAWVLHQSQGSIKKHVKRQYVKQVRRRNKYLLEWIHTPVGVLGIQVIPLTIWRLLGELIILDGVNLRGFFTALAKLPQVTQVRRELRKNCKYSQHQVLEIMKDTVNQYCVAVAPHRQ